MKIAALILGILGGLAGIAGSIFALFIGGMSSAMELKGASQVIGLGYAAMPLSLLGIIGGALANARPKASGIMMLISGIGGFIAISTGFIIAGPLLIVGGILALMYANETGAGAVANNAAVTDSNAPAVDGGAGKKAVGFNSLHKNFGQRVECWCYSS